ncbi:hypothetical protein HWV62_7040 [Athelia sp. TMB]|nr:hypothetical protein HWV62_7040 [Athelia sp. TMB]
MTAVDSPFSLYHAPQRQVTAAQAAALSTPSKSSQYSPQRYDNNLGKDARYNSSGAPNGQNYNSNLTGNYDSVDELSSNLRGMAVEDDYSYRQGQGQGQNAPQMRAPPPMQQNRGPYNGYMQAEYSPYYGNGNGVEYGYPYGNNADPSLYAASANGGSNGNMYPGVAPQAMHPNAVADYNRQQAGLYYDYPRHYYPTHQTMIYPTMPSPMPTPQLSAAVPATLSDKKRELQYNIQQQMNHQTVVYQNMRSSPSPHALTFPNGLDYSAQMPMMLAGGIYNGPPAMHGFPRGMHPGRQNVLDLGMTLRSPLLDEFRANKARKWELRDILGFIVEFSGDQHGSRFIQQKLESATSEEKQMVFDEIVPDNALQLIQDVFGNYVIQKLFEYGTQVHKTILANAMEGHILPLSMQMYGCRVVQKAVEHILPEQQVVIVRELEPHVLKCVKDANGNHVIQKLIERVSPDRLGFVASFRGSVYELSTHPYGCRVLQRCFEHLPEDQTRPLLDELHKYTINLMQDQFGNYVIQFVLEHGQPQDKALVINKLRGQMLQMARHKFASNVCEKALVTADSATRSMLIDEIMALKQEGSGAVVQMMKDQFANYVLQRALVVAEGEQKELLISKIRPQLAAMRRYSSAYSKHLISIERLLEKCGSKPLSDQSQEQSIASSPIENN